MSTLDDLEKEPSISRCSWVNLKNPSYVAYHDTEWGEKRTDSKSLFEFLILETAQAGLSWETILSKRKAYQKLFHDFNPDKVAQKGQRVINQLMEDSSIIRNRKKIESTIQNARSFLEVEAEFGTFFTYLQSFNPENHNLERDTQNKQLQIAKIISSDLKRRNFSFVGETIVYSYLEAIGIFNNHQPSCYKHTT